MTAQGITKIPWAGNTPQGENQEPAAQKPRPFIRASALTPPVAAAEQPRRSFAEELKAQFRAVAIAVIHTLATEPAPRRKRKEEGDSGSLSAAPRSLAQFVKEKFHALAVWFSERQAATAFIPSDRQRTGDGFPPVPEAARLLWDTQRWHHHRANIQRRRLPVNQNARRPALQTRPLSHTKKPC